MSEFDEALARQMVKVMGPRIRSVGYKEAREQTLRAYRFEDSTEEEIEAYRRFLDRHFNERAVAATKRKHRPRTPLHVYEGDTK